MYLKFCFIRAYRNKGTLPIYGFLTEICTCDNVTYLDVQTMSALTYTTCSYALSYCITNTVDIDDIFYIVIMIAPPSFEQ